MMRFTLTIDMGDDKMRTGNDIGVALQQVAKHLRDWEFEIGDSCPIWNRVGVWAGEWRTIGDVCDVVRHDKVKP